MANVKGSKAMPQASRRGRPHKATIEALNGGGFKTTLHHHPANPTSDMYQPRPEPIESAHKTYKQARKVVDGHFGQEPAAAPPAESAPPAEAEPME